MVWESLGDLVVMVIIIISVIVISVGSVGCGGSVGSGSGGGGMVPWQHFDIFHRDDPDGEGAAAAPNDHRYGFLVCHALLAPRPGPACHRTSLLFSVPLPQLGQSPSGRAEVWEVVCGYSVGCLYSNSARHTRPKKLPHLE